MVVDRGWNLIEANAGVALLTDGVAEELLAPPANVLRVSLHPDGMAPRIVNLGEGRSHLLGRLRREVALTADTGLSRLLNELRTYPCDQPEPEVEIPGPGDIVVPLRIRHEGRELAFFSTVATFGTPLDVTASELAIESPFPPTPRLGPCFTPESSVKSSGHSLVRSWTATIPGRFALLPELPLGSVLVITPRLSPGPTPL